MESTMVLFDLNNTQPAVANALDSSVGPARAFQPDVLATVKSGKRVSSYPWPFCVKNSMAPDSSGQSHSSPATSSFGS